MSDRKRVMVEQRTYDELMTQDEIYRYLNRVQVNLPAYKAGLQKAKAKLRKVLTAAEPALVPDDIECTCG